MYLHLASSTRSILYLLGKRAEMASTSMLLCALVVLLVGSEAAAIAISECPKNLPHVETIQIPHEDDCTKFYSCLGDMKILRDCPLMDNEGNRLFFNAELHLCDYPSHANCDLPLPARGA
ncbi:uncharacterized protein [Venturia canescens]|uniref:uncharacterized protein n=1 Tax=Venturia canescens TaxID=32260 RepID=UPI001C9CBB8D|nr:uncharacterized protein LOC122416606 [Venturia canescens]